MHAGAVNGDRRGTYRGYTPCPILRNRGQGRTTTPRDTHTKELRPSSRIYPHRARARGGPCDSPEEDGRDEEEGWARRRHGRRGEFVVWVLRLFWRGSERELNGRRGSDNERVQEGARVLYMPNSGCFSMIWVGAVTTHKP